MKLLQRAIWALILSAAVAGFADNLGRPSPRERAPHVRVLSKPTRPGPSSPM
jgi:hypothetical protein